MADPNPRHSWRFEAYYQALSDLLRSSLLGRRLSTGCLRSSHVSAGRVHANEFSILDSSLFCLSRSCVMGDYVRGDALRNVSATETFRYSCRFACVTSRTVALRLEVVQAGPSAQAWVLTELTLLLPDRLSQDAVPARIAVARLIGLHRPSLVFTALGSGVHPDLDSDDP